MIDIEIQCQVCKEDQTVVVKQEDLEAWTSPNPPYVQDAFPYLTPGERELFLSGICDSCFNVMFTRR